jgi:cyclophilin family peptidyl-prolyl cis-trans isomerase/HEAT repeat protein
MPRPAWAVPLAPAMSPLLALVTVLPLAAQVPPPQPLPAPGRYAAQWERVLVAEDARAATAEGLGVLRLALGAREPELRVMAVRALGRFERPDLVPDILPLLDDSASRVRAYAANALAQAVVRGDEAQRVRARAALLRILDDHAQDSVAAPVIAEALGRVRHANVEHARATVARLLAMPDRMPHGTPALRGLYFLARQQDMRAAFDESAFDVLRQLARTAQGDLDDDAVRHRTLAVATLAAAGGADLTTLRAVLSDAAPFVRREAVVAGSALADTAAALDIIVRGMNDGSGIVRYDAVRQYSRRFTALHGCGPVRTAMLDAHIHTALLAIDLIGACGDGVSDADMLLSLARSIGTAGAAWHRPAHALVSLAAVDPQQALGVLAAFIAHPNIFVRMYAARAAARARDTGALRRLAADPHANVRTAALQGLRTVAGRAADDSYIAQLERDESELLQAAAAALDGTARSDALPALLAALRRVTALGRETSRDARRALLVRIRQLGNATHAGQLVVYLTDFDPVIADAAADIMGEWTGTRPQTAPAPPPPLPLPSFEETLQLAAASVLIELADGRQLRLRLFAFEAPTNAARFARLARSGYYDGLTFHRVVPNFVVQGGSPGANEYSGDAAFSRDELGLARNWRGAVGLSTRGRDTGDAQFFINTVDNVRLDHDYTIFGEIVHGLDIVDGLLEGAVIRRIEVTQ